MNVSRFGLVIYQSFNGTSLKEMLLYYFGNVLRLYAAVKGSLGIYYHYRSERTKTEAARSDYLYFLCKPTGGNLGNQSLLNFLAV